MPLAKADSVCLFIYLGFDVYYCNPNILLFDEPTSGLDPITGDLIDDLIKNNVAKLGVSTITITHDMSSVFKYANRVILINKNKIDWSGKPKEMLKSNNLTIKKFLNTK